MISSKCCMWYVADGCVNGRQHAPTHILTQPCTHTHNIHVEHTQYALIITHTHARTHARTHTHTQLGHQLAIK